MVRIHYQGLIFVIDNTVNPIDIHLSVDTQADKPSFNQTEDEAEKRPSESEVAGQFSTMYEGSGHGSSSQRAPTSAGW